MNVTYIAQTQPVALGGAWVPISTYDHPRTLGQALSDVKAAIAQDKSPTPSPKRVVVKTLSDGVEHVVWTPYRQSASSSSSTQGRGSAK